MLAVAMYHGLPYRGTKMEPKPRKADWEKSSPQQNLKNHQEGVWQVGERMVSPVGLESGQASGWLDRVL